MHTVQPSPSTPGGYEVRDADGNLRAIMGTDENGALYFTVCHQGRMLVNVTAESGDIPGRVVMYDSRDRQRAMIVLDNDDPKITLFDQYSRPLFIGGLLDPDLKGIEP